MSLHQPTAAQISSNSLSNHFTKNYPNHTQSVERAVKMTITASGQIADSKRQIGEALCTLDGRKKQWIGKKYHVPRKAARASQ